MKFAAIFLLATALFADGGSVLVRRQSGSFIVTVFGTPQVGSTDLSVLVQSAADSTPVLDASVDLRVEHSTVRATHAQAINKLLYAAFVNLPRVGPSHLQIRITRGADSVALDAGLQVAPAPAPLLAYWPYVALVPAAILLFALNQWLKNRRTKRRPAPP